MYGMGEDMNNGVELTTARNRRDQETPSPLRMPANPSKCQRKDGREAARLKHEDHDEKPDACSTMGVHGGDGEDSAHS